MRFIHVPNGENSAAPALAKTAKKGRMGEVVASGHKGGRPRSELLHQAMLKAALDLVLEVGFRGVSVEGIAARTGVGKTTVYRRWPNKAAVVMDAFIGLLGPAS